MDGFAKTQVPVPEAPVAPAPVPADDLSLPLLFRLAAAAVLIATVLSLTACGGGGGVDSPVPPPPPAPAFPPSALIAAQLTVPSAVGYDTERLAAFDRLNEVRLSAGLGMLAQSTAMDQAAQAHADWMIANDSFTHDEVAGTIGFTGENFGRRDESFGYVPAAGGEVISGGASGSTSVDALVNAIYHRAVILAFEPVDVGVGWSSQTAVHVSEPLVVDLARPGTDAVRGPGQASQPSIEGAAIWPLDGARDVPMRLGMETPNPVPTQEVLTLGTPASITVEGSKAIHASSFVMTNVATATVVTTQILSNQSDPNLFIPKSFIGLIPLSALSANTTYAVVFSGNTIEASSGASRMVNRTWSFTTASR